VLVAGDFTGINNIARNRIARLNTDGTLDSTFQSRMTGVGSGYLDAAVYSIVATADGKVLIGGNFTFVDDIPAARIARLWCNQPPYIESVTRAAAGSATMALRLQHGTTNRLQYQSSLGAPGWSDLPGDITPGNTTNLAIATDTSIGLAPQRFYRVWQLP